jgi:hypothetical protein
MDYVIASSLSFVQSTACFEPPYMQIGGGVWSVADEKKKPKWSRMRSDKLRKVT